MRGTGARAVGFVAGLLFAMGAVVSPVRAEAPDADASATYPRPAPGQNLLALEASPYLQLHAHNPVDWYPWGDRAFERAKAEDKIVFLSVGYSTCYWCHVMERESFSDPEIAAFMNAHFVSVKVDREERPDLDDIYMTATQLLAGRGGWPNSVFLTPEGKPFYAGTYFPPADRPGRPGFPSVLRSLQAAWSNERAGVLATAEQVTQRLERIAAAGAGTGPNPPTATGEVTARAIARLRSDFDREYGGFGRGTKFPRAPVLDLLLTRLEQERRPEVEEMLVRTLDAMALGGIYDHLADGFHRYSTERTWSVPHFEKMLYDNAQLVSIYARAYALTQRPLYRRVVERTLAYLDREMSHDEGGFFSAQDAEVDGEEGASYVWSRGEIETVLGAQEAEAFLSVYELVPLPEHSNFGVLRVRLSASSAPLERFDAARASLLAQRSKRAQPLRDDKVLAAWNGLAIRALVDAAAALDRPDWLRRAERAAQFVLRRLRMQDGTLRRSYIAGQARERGVLDDYAFLADGLLSLHGATGDARWLSAARSLGDVLLASFEDASGGGFFLTPLGADLLIRPKPYEDSALPSGNSAALRVMRVLARDPGSERYERAAAGTAASAGALLARAPQALPAILAVLAAGDPTGAPALPGSEAHVRARLVRSAGSDPPALTVEVVVEEGWHVNANPASFDFLVPTSVERIDGPAAIGARYPPGKTFRPAFTDEAIQVYEGRVEIPLILDAAELPGAVALRYQACDASSCLPPHREVLRPDAAPPP